MATDSVGCLVHLQLTSLVTLSIGRVCHREMCAIIILAMHVGTGQTNASCCKCAGQSSWGLLAARYDCGMLDWLTLLPRHFAWCPSRNHLRPRSITPSLLTLARPQAAEDRPCQVPSWLHISSLQVIGSAPLLTQPFYRHLAPPAPVHSVCCSLLIARHPRTCGNGCLAVQSPQHSVCAFSWICLIERCAKQ